MKYGLGRSILALAVIAVLAAATPAMAALTVSNVYTGNVAVSTDGFGSTSQSGTISASVPAGATVLAAYLYSATWNTSGGPIAPTGTFNGSAVAYGPLSANIISASFALASARADVTSIVSGVVGPIAVGGIYDFEVTEGNAAQDGEALVVVYSLPSLPVATVGILDGFSAVDGDSTSINFANPLDPSDPAFFADMRLGISFSCCSQRSDVTVNGTLITENAGNNDDGAVVSNGSLITVGGFDDPYSALLPSYGDDHERYDLKPYVSLGDTSISVLTNNPSRDDNIFLATFYVSGEATITNNVPEPGSLTLLGLGLAGLARRFSGRRRTL